MATLGVNAARLQQSILSATSSNVTTLQAYQYAESKVDIVKLIKYDELTAQAKKDITNSNYQDEVLLSEEVSNDSYKERTATVNVFLKGETRPRATLKVIRSSVEPSAGVPIGTILAWPSNILPKDGGVWLLCNGQSTAGYPQLSTIVGSNVPDYRGIFLRGYGSQVSTHYGTVTHSSAALGELQGDAAREIWGSFTSYFLGGYADQQYDVKGAFGVSGARKFAGTKNRDDYSPEFTFYSSKVVPTANENRPINRAVNWIIKAA